MQTNNSRNLLRARIARLIPPIPVLWLATSLVLPTFGNANEVRIDVRGNQRCVVSNGLPAHTTGTFPNPGNPGRITEQRHRFCVPANPVRQSRPTVLAGTTAIAVNGVLVRPGTADFYDAGSTRGFSREGDRRCRLEGMGNADALGMDQHNAHTDPRGIYHYHGVPHGLVANQSSSHIAYAADGFEIHRLPGKRASYRLKAGTRPYGPGRRYDGICETDWEFVAGSGDLDQCNGGVLNGRYVYFVTDSFPFWPRCVFGEVSEDFRRGPGGGGDARGERDRRGRHGHRHRRGHGHGHPPPPRHRD